MLCLGIESTAHTFGAAVVDGNRNVLSNEKDSYSTRAGGMIPAQLGEHHVECCDRVIRSALRKAGVRARQLSLIAFSQGPGLGHALRVGALAARTLAVSLTVPIVGVNHCIAHLEIGRLCTPAKDPILLYVSGANTQIIAYEAGKYRIFGETLDIGIGNFLDVLAREVGAGFPGGPVIEQLALRAQAGKRKPRYIELPYVVKGMDVSFGGLLTNLKHKIRTGKHTKEDIAYSAQETVFAMLVEVTERALAHTDKSEVVLGGGVACNKRLVQMCGLMCSERGAKSYLPETQFLLDNAAMIAWLGVLKYNAQKGRKGDRLSELAIRPYERTDDVDVVWR